jgi:predicted signal transduction protein with EAL and GGDEF domain
VSQEVTYHGQAVKIGASIGTAIYPDDALAPEELISLADVGHVCRKTRRQKPRGCANERASRNPRG